ncbi:MAG TPA: tetratricopeptide repeat protein [Pyrinomonadaceae bacterium]
MGKLNKHGQKLRFMIVVSVGLGLAFVAISCHPSATPNQLTTGSSDAKAAADRIAEADTLYAGRDDLNKARVAVAALRQARTADYGNYEAAWKLSRAAFYVGDHTDNNSERDDMFREGIEAGKNAVTLQPNKADGHFWLGANYGGSAAHSTLAGLSSFRDIKNEMDAVLKIDESYEGYSTYLGLGRLYLEAPTVLGGDSKQAIAYLEKGLKMNPNHTMMRAELAQAYIATNRPAEAKKEIQIILSATPDPKYAPEHKDALAKAQKLQQKLG